MILYLSYKLLQINLQWSYIDSVIFYVSYQLLRVIVESVNAVLKGNCLSSLRVRTHNIA